MAEEGRPGTAATPEVRKDLQAHARHPRRRVEQMTTGLEAAIEGGEVCRAKGELLRGVPGIGPGASRTLLACPPELGGLDGKRIAAPAGLAPMARDGGTSRGRRRIIGGRAEVRSASSMATPSAVRSNPTLEASYGRPRDAGKPARLASTAAAGKLMGVLKAMLKAKSGPEPPASRRRITDR